MNGSQDDVLEGEEDGPKKDKHDWGAADLEKVNAHVDDNDEDASRVTSSEKLGSLMQATQQDAQPVVNVRKEDVEMIMNELELPRVRVERLLIHHKGDVRAAMRTFIG